MTIAATTKKIVYLPLDSLLRKVNVANPKDHDLGLIATSIKRFGFIGSVTLDAASDSLVAGHGRLGALAMLRRETPTVPPEGIRFDGESWLVPTTYETFADEYERNAYLVADNQTVVAGGWNNGALAEMLSAIAEETERGLDGTGFDGDALDDLMAIVNGTDAGAETSPPRVGGLDHSYRAEAFGVTVNLDSKTDEDALVDLIRAHGFEAKRHSK